MKKGGGYLLARTRQPPTAQTIKKEELMWVRGVVCRFYECRCMSDGVFIQFVCQFLILMVIQIKVCQRCVCAYSLCR